MSKMVTTRKNQRRTDEQKRFIVESLGCFQTPTQVARTVRERFEIEVTPQAIEGYDPTKTAGKSLNSELCAWFYQARQNYIARVENIGVSHQVYRLEVLQAGVERNVEKGNYQGAAAFLEQAAKEMGGMYHARHAHPALVTPTPIIPRVQVDLSKLSIDELKFLERISRRMEEEASV